MTAPTRYRLGRKAPNLTKGRVFLTVGHVPDTYTPPATLDRYSAVPADSWGMDGNDDVGDCTCADVDHEVKSDQVAAGNPEVQSTTDEVLAAYSAITGYNPDDPNSDQGAEMQSVREYWRKTGFRLGGQVHKILLFAELHQQDLSLVKWSLDQFGSLGVGVNLPNSAMDQFNAGQPWDVVPDDGGIDGGHAVALVGYDAEYAYLVTWGRVQRATWAWWARYVEEVWTVLTQDFVNEHTGLDPLAGTLYDLGDQFKRVTGQPNPVPPPAPDPTPTPVPPTPGPGPDPVPPAPTPEPPAPDPAEADARFAGLLHDWLNGAPIERLFKVDRIEHAARVWLVARRL
jgi:hypothetical protein